MAVIVVITFPHSKKIYSAVTGETASNSLGLTHQVVYAYNTRTLSKYTRKRSRRVDNIRKTKQIKTKQNKAKQTEKKEAETNLSHHPDALAPAPLRRLDHHRKPDALALPGRLLGRGDVRLGVNLVRDAAILVVRLVVASGRSTDGRTDGQSGTGRGGEGAVGARRPTIEVLVSRVGKKKTSEPPRDPYRAMSMQLVLDIAEHNACVPVRDARVASAVFMLLPPLNSALYPRGGT